MMRSALYRGSKSTAFAVRHHRSASTATLEAQPFNPYIPFATSTTTALREALLPAATATLSTPHDVLCRKQPSEAAVLIPLINMRVEGATQPAVVMQLRSTAMRTHGGEISFPGGKVDPLDKSLIDTALRETQEELGIAPEHVEILGSLPPAWSLGNRSRVWPFVGFVHDRVPSNPSSISSALSSPGIDELVLSQDEVAAVLPLPLSVICDSKRHSTHFFRLDGAKPYTKIRVDDLLSSQLAATGPGGQPIEVWGLSGWFLSQLAWRAGWLVPPDPYVPGT